MRDVQRFIYRATTLYDRPGPQFTAHVPLETKLNLFHKLSENDPEFRKLTYADNRPKLLITSTSWTEDEDFWLLLNTLRGMYINHKHGSYTEIFLQFNQI